jgi:putative transposase
MVEKNNPELSMVEQCQILGLNRSTLYYKPVPEYSPANVKILNAMDEIFTKYPYFGYRRIYDELVDSGYVIGENRVNKYMKVLGLETFYPKKKTSIPNKNHKVYPYLLKDIEIAYPNQVWCADITYIRMQQGFCYLVVIMDWYSRYVLSWRLSNTLDVDFCVEALQEALWKYPSPAIFNTDQGSQFTSEAFTQILLNNQIQISMDSKGRAFDNIIIERFFRSLKYEHIYLYNHPIMLKLRAGISWYMNHYNNRKHSSLKKQTPYEVYNKKEVIPLREHFIKKDNIEIKNGISFF